MQTEPSAQPQAVSADAGEKTPALFERMVPVIALFTSFIILCLGNGLQSVLLPARATLQHYPDLLTGGLMSAYYFGFIGGTFVCPWMIARVGHIRIFAAAASGAAAIMLIHALTFAPWAWLLLRALYGLCLVHLFTVMESWINSVGDNQTRGKILSIYMIANFVSMSAGQLLFFTASAEGFELFSFSAILLSSSLLPLMLSRISQPAQVDPPEPFGLLRLYATSPLGVIGSLTAGLMAGAYWGLTASYILKEGYAQQDVAWFMAASLLGGLSGQWPLGLLSDRTNRRYAILIALALIGIPALMLAVTGLWSAPREMFGTAWLIGWGIVFGAGFHPLYSLCMAHTNDFVPREYFVRASAGLQFTQSIGAVVGPLLAGLLMRWMGNEALFAYIAALALAFAVYTMWRMVVGRLPVMAHPFRIFARLGAIISTEGPRNYH